MAFFKAFNLFCGWSPSQAQLQKKKKAEYCLKGGNNDRMQQQRLVADE